MHCLIVNAEPHVKKQTLKNRRTRKVNKKVLQEQFLCTIGKQCIYFGEIFWNNKSKKLFFFSIFYFYQFLFFNFQFFFYCCFFTLLLILTMKKRWTKWTKNTQISVRKILHLPASNFWKYAPGADSAAAKVCHFWNC